MRLAADAGMNTSSINVSSAAAASVAPNRTCAASEM
jgi:hypothetical protein